MSLVSKGLKLILPILLAIKHKIGIVTYMCPFPTSVTCNNNNNNNSNNNNSVDLDLENSNSINDDDNNVNITAITTTTNSNNYSNTTNNYICNNTYNDSNDVFNNSGIDKKVVHIVPISIHK